MFSKRGPNPWNQSSETYDFATTLLFLVIPSIIAIILLLRYICARVSSSNRHPRSSAPRYPSWLIGNLCTPELRDSVSPFPGFSVYTKEYNRRTLTNRKNVEERARRILRVLRKMLSKMSNMTIDWEVVPDTTCIISIPKMNFRSGVMPGTFVPIHGGPPDDSYFEYEMIGDYRIQAVYYIVGGVEYVAGLCIYLEDPYQEPIKYNQSIIWKLMKSPDYWSTWNLKKETMHIIKKEWSQRPQVAASNKYGEQFHFVYWYECKSWSLGSRKGTPIDREFENEEDPKVQSKFMNVRLCEAEGNMVVVAERNGKKVHVNWNKEMKEMEFTACDSCQDDPPPSYKTAVPEKVILFDYRLW